MRFEEPYVRVFKCSDSQFRQNDKNSLFGFGHRDPKNSGGDRVPASIGTPKQLAGRADSPRKPISAFRELPKGGKS